MKKVKYAFFAFQPSDCEAAQLWLTRLYDQGWELAHLPHFILPAKFIPRTRDDIKYCVDLSHGVRDPNFAPDGFDQLVKESGWALVGTSRSGLDVYKSLPDRDPIPIQTDPLLVKKQFWRNVLLPDLVCTAFILVLLVIFLLITPPLFHFSPALLLSNWELLRVACALFLFVSIPLKLACDFMFWRRSGHTPPEILLRHGRIRAVCFGALSLAVLYILWAGPVTQLVMIGTREYPERDPQVVDALPLLTPGDLGLEEDAAPELWRQGSVMASELELVEYTDGTSLTQKRWDCRFGWVAEQIVAGTLASHERYMPHIPTDLGFDQAWTYTSDNYHALLLRQGNTVVHLYGGLDLTTPDRLERLRDALKLAS